LCNKKSKKVQEFIDNIIYLSKKFNLSIAHEDVQGAFVIKDYSEDNISWFRNAFDCTVNNNVVESSNEKD